MEQTDNFSVEILTREMAEELKNKTDEEIASYLATIHPKKVDKDELSKRKFIYEIYYSGNLNIKRHPIIYINSRYVYFKVPGNDKLQMTSLNNIKDNVLDIDFKNILSGYMHKYVWSINTMDEEIDEPGLHVKTIKAINEMLAKKVIDDQIENYENQLHDAQLKRDLYVLECNNLQNIISTLKNKK